MTYAKGTPEERFWVKVCRDPDTNCWDWCAGLDDGGYGKHWVGRHARPKAPPAHVFAYRLLVGPIPEGKRLDHLCRNRRCCNPDHLEPVTSRENTMRSPIAPAAVHSRQTHCIHGHPLFGPNLYVWTSPDGKRVMRQCKICCRAKAKRWLEKKRRERDGRPES